MNLSNLLNDVAGKPAEGAAGNPLAGLSKNIPGGLAGGAVAGGLVAMLVGSKSARKTAGKAAKYGGAALLGGMAYKAYKGWQANNAAPAAQDMPQQQVPQYNQAQHQVSPITQQTLPTMDQFERETYAHANGDMPEHFQLLLLKAMIAAARADGQIDEAERAKIFQAVKDMNMDKAAKTELLDLFLQPIAMHDLVHELQTLEQKAEVYLASCLAIDLDEEAEYAYLSELSRALALPPGLEQQLRAQASNAIRVAA